MMKAAIYISLFVATFGHWHAANGQLSESQKDFVLTTHNQFRSEVSPTANIMLEMVCRIQNFMMTIRIIMSIMYLQLTYV